MRGGPTRTAGGTGLNPAAAREFSRMLGGDIEVQSELGRGSNFTLSGSLAPRPDRTERDGSPTTPGDAAGE